MLLARKGYQVLLVDRTTFPSDTVSTHVVQPLGVQALWRWGLLDQLTASGCPEIHTYAFDFGPLAIAGAPGTPDCPVAYCPRRTILDSLLFNAAALSGAEVREGFTVDELMVEDERVVGVLGRSKDGHTTSERAQIVVGADGRHSRVAECVRPERYNCKPPFIAGYYSYWSGLPMNGRFETYIRPDCGFAAAPTHDGLTMLVAGWPYSQFTAKKHDLENAYLAVISQAPQFAERLRSARRETRLAGTGVPNYFCKPYGPGWALVGDAGYSRDFITAQGIKDAFLDAERCAEALHDYLSGASTYEGAMGSYQRNRDEGALPMFEFTCQLASLEPPTPEMQRLFGAIAQSQEAMNGFAQVNAGTISPAVFFAPDNIARLVAIT
jgi:2-polyprenyl-6-methoxyphenol hydroxylase-like FAD-dependent oxidoreductase